MAINIYCLVTNDLNYDQRMQRICATLAQEKDFNIRLIGRQLKKSQPLQEQSFQQQRLSCFFNKGKLFYLEYNIRLFFLLLFAPMDIICAVDLDTILPAYYIAKWRKKKIVYDAHEIFTQVPEVVERPKVQAVWEWIAQKTIPKVDAAYTVCQSLANYFKENYQRDFQVIRNVPFAQKQIELTTWNLNEPFVILYQGVLNDGRGLEEILQAMPYMPNNVHFYLAGEGDKSVYLRQLAKDLNLNDRVKFLGYLLPKDLKQLTPKCQVGLNLLQNKGLNYYYSLANKFFDYIQAAKPSLNMNFPEYQQHIENYEVGLLLPDLQIKTIVQAIEKLQDPLYYAQLQKNCLQAAQDYTWERESIKLIDFYKTLLI